MNFIFYETYDLIKYIITVIQVNVYYITHILFVSATDIDYCLSRQIDQHHLQSTYQSSITFFSILVILQSNCGALKQ